MPGLLDGARAAAVSRRVPSRNRDRLLRELADTFEALGGADTLVLVVDDIQWIDRSSADMLANTIICPPRSAMCRYSGRSFSLAQGRNVRFLFNLARCRADGGYERGVQAAILARLTV